MRPRMLAWLVCPSCGGSLEIEGASGELRPDTDVPGGVLRCGKGHCFAIRNGVPRLLALEKRGSRSAAGEAHSDAAVAIADSFGAEWEHFDYEKSRTWHQTVEDRCRLFLREVDMTAAELAGKVVLAAGCGNGTLSV